MVYHFEPPFIRVKVTKGLCRNFGRNGVKERDGVSLLILFLIDLHIFFELLKSRYDISTFHSKDENLHKISSSFSSKSEMFIMAYIYTIAWSTSIHSHQDNAHQPVSNNDSYCWGGMLVQK